MAKMSDLESAYRASTYRVFLPGGGCDLRIGIASETLRCWLETAGATRFAILTAHNPGSLPVAAADNALRQSQLECALLEQGYEPYVGENIADDDSWPPEESCFVPDIPLAAALALGERYGQTAIVCGGSEAVPELVWTGTPPAREA
jgi:Protein of unknown function (DUF3293)